MELIISAGVAAVVSALVAALAALVGSARQQRAEVKKAAIDATKAEYELMFELAQQRSKSGKSIRIHPFSSFLLLNLATVQMAMRKGTVSKADLERLLSDHRELGAAYEGHTTIIEGSGSPPSEGHT